VIVRAGSLLLLVAWSTGAWAAPDSAKPTPQKNCVLPAVEFEDGDPALTRHFAPASKRFARLQLNVRAGFQRACNKRLIAGSNIGELESVPMRRMWIRNTPDGNVATLSADQLPGGTGWRLVLEHPFVASDGSVNVPSAVEIEEAIYCSVQGATPRAQEATGRCLVD
jgi:hypothetical protein